MKTIKHYLLKLLMGVVIGAVLGALVGWLVLGQGVVILAILGALAFASLGFLYNPNVIVHSYPNSRGETSAYNRDTSPYNRDD